MKLTLGEIQKRVTCEADAYVVLEELRWPTGPVCPHCGHDKAYFLTPKNKVSRATGPKRTMSQRRVWKCAKCRKQFSVLTGTIFQGTKVPVETWLMVMVQMCSAKNGVSAREVERMHGVTPETAWFMLHRLREAMRREPLASKLQGTVVVDETWVGPDMKNMHQQGKPRFGPRNHTGNPAHETPVVALVHKESGKVRTEVVRGRKLTTPKTREFLARHVDIPGSTLHTDSARGYRAIGREFKDHQAVDHSAREYVRGDVSTNPAESFFAQLKRSIDGTHHHVSKTHLGRCADEFAFRYSTSKMTDAERPQTMMDQAAGRRLTYRPLQGR